MSAAEYWERLRLEGIAPGSYLDKYPEARCDLDRFLSFTGRWGIPAARAYALNLTIWRSYAREASA